MVSQQLILILVGLTGTVLSQNDRVNQKRDLEQLLDFSVPFAKQMLTEHGEFFPHASSMNVDGKVAAVAGYTGEEHPESTDVIDLLRGAFHREAEAGKIRACAVVYDVRTIPPGKTEKTDAIAVELDHRGGMSIIVIYPYSLTADKKLTVGDSYAVKGQGKIFSASSSHP